MREWQPAVLVVGLPYNVDGSESAAAAAARAASPASSRERYALPVELVDERYSSLEAEERLKRRAHRACASGASPRADVDAAAACVILERWFSEKT